MTRDTDSRRVPLRERFEAKFDRGAPDECWPWRGAKSEGYGIIAPPGGLGRTARDPKARKLYAHRVSYELYVGPIPEGMTIDHVAARGCRLRSCVNPAHLEPVAGPENTRRGRGARSRLTAAQVEELRALRSQGWLLRELADRYGLSVSRTHSIATGAVRPADAH